MDRTITIGSELSSQLALILWLLNRNDQDELKTESHFEHFIAVETNDLYVSFTASIEENNLLDQFWNYINLEGRDSGMDKHRARARVTALRPLGLYPYDPVKRFPAEYHDDLISEYRYMPREKELHFQELMAAIRAESQEKREGLLAWCEEYGVDVSKFRPTLGEVADEVLGGMIYGPNTMHRKLSQMNAIFDRLAKNHAHPPNLLKATQELWNLKDQGIEPPLLPHGPIPEEWVKEVCGDEIVANLRSRMSN